MSPGPSPFRSLPRPARVLVWSVVGAAATALAAAGLLLEVQLEVLPFAILLGLCALGSFSEVRAPGGYWLQPHLPAFVAAAALLPPAALGAVAVATFLPGALHRREPWYRPTFNTATFGLAGAAAGAITHTVVRPDGAAAQVLALFAGALALVAVNHVLVSAVSSLAAGESRRTALWAAARLRRTAGAGVLYDTALALSGASLAALWHAFPQALPLAAGPAALACASLWVPMLRHRSRTDPKTGLFNSAYVRHRMQIAIDDARRSGTPASILMVDLDHLRRLNNRHGHLAGDTVIAAVAGVLAEHAGGRGSAGRFGGEEFCAVLPGLSTAAAAEVAEAVRAHVEAMPLGLGAANEPAGTVSIGVGTFPVHGEDVDAVLHAADMALYDAKLGGRNRVRVAPPEGVGDLAPAPQRALAVPAEALLDAVARNGAQVPPHRRRRVAPFAVRGAAARQERRRMRTGVAQLRRSHAELEAANEHLRRLLRDNTALVSRLQQSYLSTITSLARTVEAKDPYTGGHTERVARVATRLAQELGFSEDELRAVEVGAVIHDIGNIGVPDTTRLKPGPLSVLEREEIERHPEISSSIVAELDVPAIVKQMVRSHHERYDGAGYPDGLAGEEIPLAARILTVADALDAMTSDRPYRRARPLHEAIDAIEAHAGTQFCPAVVAALRDCLRAAPDVHGPLSIVA